eukprot:6457930-Prymnesium_polylepis.1
MPSASASAQGGRTSEHASWWPANSHARLRALRQSARGRRRSESQGRTAQRRLVDDVVNDEVGLVDRLLLDGLQHGAHLLLEGGPVLDVLIRHAGEALVVLLELRMDRLDERLQAAVKLRRCER